MTADAAIDFDPAFRGAAALPLIRRSRNTIALCFPKNEQRRRRFGKPFAIIFAAIPLAAQGQDALFSALSLDKSVSMATNSAVDLTRPGPYVGPVQVNANVFVGASYNDNINASQTAPQADVILTAGTTLGFVWPATDQSQITFGSGISYNNYVRRTQNSGLQITPDSALTYSVTIDDWRLTAFDQLSYLREVVTEGALANLSTLPRLENTAGLRAEWDPGKWTSQVGYSHTIYLSEGGSDNFLNHSSEDFFFRGGRRFAENTEFGIEASGSLTSYESSLQQDSQSVSFGGYADWQLRPAIHATLRGGPTIYFFDSTGTNNPASTLNSYYVVAQVIHQLTDYVSQTLNIERDVQLGLNQGSSFIEEFTASYSVNWRLTRALGIGINLDYESGNQPLPFSVGPFIVQRNENYTRYGGGLQLSWQATDKISTTLGYSYWDRQSNIAGRSYNANMVSLGVTYTF